MLQVSGPEVSILLYDTNLKNSENCCSRVYQAIFTLHTTTLKIQNSTLCPTVGLHVCVSEQRLFYLYNINWWFFVRQKVYCAVRKEYVSIIQV